ncbi:MAG: Ig-like domain-containing protein, partial [Clostridia bacterium]|nr:Ig-like domain-containing protein [Clostridia bacterium]
MKRMQLGKRTMALLTALFILLGTLPFSMGHVHAEEPTDYPTIALDTEETVTLDGVDAREKVFAFTPDESGFYAFKSLHNTEDPVGRILDAEGNELVRSDDIVDSYEFAAVYSMEAGTTYLLEVTLHDQDQSASVTVKVTRAKLPTEVSLDVGDTYTNSVFSHMMLDYAISPADADCTPHFQSSDPETVLVDEAGNIFLGKPGSATVTVTAAPGVTDSVVITVLDAIDITLDTAYPAANERGLSSTFRFTPEETAFYCFFSDLENDTCVLEIYRAGGEYVDSTSVFGERLAQIGSLEAGETYYYRIESFTYDVSRSIQLVKAVDATEISLNYTEIDGTVGTTAQLVATASPINSLLPALTWSSADESVATVDENGRITLLSQGSTTVTASSEEFVVSCAVRVIDVPVLSREKIADAHIYAPEESAIFTFTPELDGYYAFWSISNSDTYGVLCDAEGQILAEADNGIEGANFLIPYHLTAG